MKGYVNCLLFLSCSLLFGEQTDVWLLEDDTSLVLPDNEPEKLVSMTGQLYLHTIDKDPENESLGKVSYWVLKMDSKSFEIACTTPVRSAFQSPQSIRDDLQCYELELTGNYEETWLNEHANHTITLSGYLWHAHTAHHHTPVLMDADPWFKDISPK
ncbi:MAG: DUF4431 domain-containing protein [Chlamydiia bacterium]|nr:DUF4431 domain-containing protein [Chlamydiia bacterium]